MKTTEHRPLPDLDYLKSRLRLDKSTGFLYWKKRPDSQFPEPCFATTWNKKHAGKRAGTDRGESYRVVIIDRVRYYEHRIVFALAKGRDPGQLTVDHISPGKSNRPRNLQAITQKNNARRKTKIPSNNTSGVVGVWWHRTGKCWVARIKVDGRQVHLGMYRDLGQAAKVRRAAEKKHFGRYAPSSTPIDETMAERLVLKRSVQDATMDSLAHKPAAEVLW